MYLWLILNKVILRDGKETLKADLLRSEICVRHLYSGVNLAESTFRVLHQHSHHERRIEGNSEGGVDAIAVKQRRQNARKYVLDRRHAELRTNLNCCIACLTW